MISALLGSVLACLAAIAAVILIHSLYQRARKRIEVATLKPFDESASPRWQMLTPEDVGLLLLRLCLIATVFVIVAWTDWQSDAVMLDGDIIAVVPGTPQQTLAISESNASSKFWLDARLTPLSETPVEAGDIRAALQRLEQRQEPGATTRVVGYLDAANWPVVSPVWSRRIVAEQMALQEQRPAQPLALPEIISIVVPEAVTRDSVLDAIRLWRDAGLLTTSTSVSILTPAELAESEFTAEGWWIVVDGKTAQRLPASANVVRLSDIPLSEQSSRGVLATRLWHALSEQEALRPVAGVSVRAVDARKLTPTVRSRSPFVRSETSPLWLVLLAGLLFLVERFWSMRQGTR